MKKTEVLEQYAKGMTLMENAMENMENIGAYINAVEEPKKQKPVWPWQVSTVLLAGYVIYMMI